MDRLTGMEAFATVVDQGGFTSAARAMGVSKSLVSKHVSALEARLGVRLLDRTTRRVSPTEIGLAYYDRACRVVNDAGEADALVTSMQAVPSGLLRISVPADYGVCVLAPIVGQFLNEYPAIKIGLELQGDAEVLLENYDLTIVVGEPAESSFKMRKLTEVTNLMVAATAYLAQRGRPETLEDLERHQLLHFSTRAVENCWRIPTGTGELRPVRVGGQLTINDNQALLQAAVSGLGIAYLPSFLCAEALKTGSVEAITMEYPADVQGVYILYPPGRYVPPKVRVFIDYLADHFGKGSAQ